MVEKLINLLPNKVAEKDAEWSKVLDEAKNETSPLVQECHGAFVSGKEELFEKKNQNYSRSI